MSILDLQHLQDLPGIQFFSRGNMPSTYIYPGTTNHISYSMKFYGMQESLFKYGTQI